VLFSAVNRILRQNIIPIARSQGLKTEDEIIAAIVGHLDRMAAEWRSGKKPNIAYEDPLCRWAYMFRQVPVQANLFRRVVEECDTHSLQFHEKLRRDELSMVILGGGPGTELLGLAKYYLRRADDEKRAQTDFEIDVIDHVVGWNENVSWIRNEINRVYSGEFGEKRGNGPARFNTNAYTLKFSDVDGFGNLPTIFKRDIFVLNFVVSEVFNIDELLHLMQTMVAGSCDDAHFLFVDRSDSKTTDKVDELITNLKLEVELRNETIDTMDGDEEKDELKEMSDFLRGQQPRLMWNAKWVLAVRPDIRF
jgi:hypothetical protein